MAVFHRMPAAISVYFAFPGMHEYLMLPIMAVFWGISSGSDLKQTHAEILRAIAFPNNDPSSDSIYSGPIENNGFYCTVFRYPHGFLKTRYE